MSTTTIDAPETTLTTFVSSCENLKLVLEPNRRRFVAEKNDWDVVSGHSIQFRNGRYQTADPDEIDFLLTHDGNGVTFHQLGMGGNGLPQDDTADQIESIFELAYEGNLDRIADLLLAERSTLNRRPVIVACETVLNRAAAAGS